MIAPPTNAIGIDAMANGQSNRPTKCPARAKRAVPIPATSTFSVSAMGFIDSGATPAIAMIARYADAPPWPTAA